MTGRWLARRAVAAGLWGQCVGILLHVVGVSNGSTLLAAVTSTVGCYVGATLL